MPEPTALAGRHRNARDVAVGVVRVLAGDWSCLGMIDAGDQTIGAGRPRPLAGEGWLAVPAGRHLGWSRRELRAVLRERDPGGTLPVRPRWAAGARAHR